MGFDVKNIISGLTYGIAGSGQSPQQSPESQTNTADIKDPMENLMEQAQQRASQYFATPPSQGVSSPSTATPTPSNQPGMFGELAGLRNGELQRDIVGQYLNPYINQITPEALQSQNRQPIGKYLSNIF